MARYIAILEDDARRREAMEALLCRRLSELKIAFFTASQAMNDWLAAHFDEVAIASLDHDFWSYCPAKIAAWSIRVAAAMWLTI
jgi:hypothetical protein